MDDQLIASELERLAAVLELRPAFGRIHNAATRDSEPLTFVAAAIGDDIALNVLAGNEDEGARALELVELLLKGASSIFRSILCTGLLEAYWSKAKSSGTQREELGRWLGPQSLAYVREWDRFHGIE
ncbi:MAG: hypothetical protein QM783_07310 [Phycisphaerales bacterium]